MQTPTLNARPIRLRHIVRVGLSVTPDPMWMGVSGTDVTFLGQSFRASAGGLNGDRGFATGEFDRRMWEEGEFRLRMQNGPGEDGRLHRERFALLMVPDARPGDEWIEVYEGDPGHLLYTACLLDAELRRGTVEVAGSDALWTLRKTHEFESGFWCNAPRDVFEHYTRAWVGNFASAFNFAHTWSSSGTPASADDGRFSILRAGTTSLPSPENNPPVGRLRLAPNATSGTARVEGTESIDIGLNQPDDHMAWRVEFRFWRSAFVSTDNVRVGLMTAGGGTEHVYFQMNENDTFHFTPLMSGADKDGFNTKKPGPFDVIIERRDRWVFFYLDGKMVAVAPAPETGATAVPYIRLATAAGGSADAWVDIDSMVLRTAQPYLMRDTDKGDYHLGSALTDLAAGGLQAIYYDDHDLIVMASSNRPYHMLNPVKPPYHRKLEDTINFPSSAWQPPGPASSIRWSARFVGCVYLDLETQDIALAVNTSGSKRRRLYVGKTRVGEHLVEQWSSPASGRTSTGGLRAHLGSVNGWYPIVVEYGHETGNSSFLLERDLNVDGTWEVVPETHLSPFGIFLAQVRGESHFDQLRALAESFGLQYAIEPRQLESGAFPGHVAPKIRVGRDTEKIIDRIEAEDFGKTASIREVADTIFADASGIADKESAGQLTAEAINFETVEDRLFVQTEYDQASEIDYKPLLARRLDVLLALRTNVWEEVGAMPKGARELLDRFPLEDDIELFHWQPGDGVRIHLPEVGIMDADPRQILGVRRTFRPDGLTRPIVSFRPRPRNFLTLLRNLKLGVTRQSRNYQNQFALVNSGLAAENDPNLTTQTARLPWPVGGQLLKAWFIMHHIVGGTWDVNVGGVSAAITGITEAGRYEITPWADQDTDVHQLTATVTATAGGTNIVRFSLEALVAV